MADFDNNQFPQQPEETPVYTPEVIDPCKIFSRSSASFSIVSLPFRQPCFGPLHLSEEKPDFSTQTG